MSDHLTFPGAKRGSFAIARGKIANKPGIIDRVLSCAA